MMKLRPRKTEGQCSGAERQPCVSNVGPPNGGCQMGTPIGKTVASSIRIDSPRTAKHKKFNLKRCKVVVNNIFKSQVKEDLVSKFNITNLNDVFAPVEVDLLSSDTSVKSPENNKNRELNASNDITNIIKTCGDGRAKNITKCSKPRCILGNEHFVPRNRVFSSTTHRTYDVKIAPGSSNVNCMSRNVVYQLTCNNCHLQYVGETCQQLNERFQSHRKGFKTPSMQISCKLLTSHFTKGICKGAGHSVQIIEKLDGDGRNGGKYLDPKSTKERKERELHWMLKLRTVYPYGLNDRVVNEFKTEHNKLIAIQFLRLDRRYVRKSHGNNSNTKVSSSTFITELQNNLQHNLKNTINYIRFTLSSMRKQQLKQVVERVNELITENPSSPYIQWYLSIIDTIDSKIYTPPEEKKKKKFSKNNCKINFVNKGIEMINISKILREPSLKINFPKQLGEYDPPTIINKLSDTTHPKLSTLESL